MCMFENPYKRKIRKGLKPLYFKLCCEKKLLYSCYISAFFFHFQETIEDVWPGARKDYDKYEFCICDYDNCNSAVVESLNRVAALLTLSVILLLLS